MEIRKKIYYSLGIFVILTIVLIGFFVYPIGKEIKKDIREIIAEKEKIISFGKEKENLERMKKFFKEGGTATSETYQSKFEKIKNLFVNSDMPLELINFLEENFQALQLDAKISSIHKKEKQNAAWPSLVLTISLKGSFANFLTFLNKLENAPYLIEILNLNMKKISQENQQPIIESSLLLNVYTK